MNDHLEFLEKFKRALGRRYNRNRAEKGDSWKDCNIEYLFGKFDEEVLELRCAAFEGRSKKTLRKEFEDVAVVSAMIWDRLG